MFQGQVKAMCMTLSSRKRRQISVYSDKSQKLKKDTYCKDVVGDRRFIVCGTFSAKFFASVDGDSYKRCGPCHVHAV